MKSLATVVSNLSLMPAPTLRAERVRRFVEAGMSDNTQTAYKKAWATFAAFCEERQYQSLPAAPEAVADYLTLLATVGRKVSTIEQAIAAITWVHRSNNHPNPRDNAQVRQVLAGIRRAVGIKPVRKAPVLQRELHAVLDAQGTDLRGIRNKAVLLVGWMGAFRRSELVALDVADVRFTESGAAITVQRSKSDQEGEGLIKHLPYQADESLCAARALRYWMNASEIEQGPLFRAINRWGKVREGYMNGKEVARLVKQSCDVAGLDSREFSGHSLRAGFVTAAAENGAQAWQICEQTGHKPNSPVINGYIRSSGRGAKGAVAIALGGKV